MGAGEGREGRGGREPGGEVGFEGELVGVARLDVLASLFHHDAILEEDVRGVDEARDVLFPDGAAFRLFEGLVWLYLQKRIDAKGDIRN